MSLSVAQWRRFHFQADGSGIQSLAQLCKIQQALVLIGISHTPCIWVLWCLESLSQVWLGLGSLWTVIGEQAGSAPLPSPS